MNQRQPGNNRSAYRLTHEEPGAIWIIDLDTGGKSVTNDAEQVTAELKAAFPYCRLYYRDSDRQWGELLYNDAGFSGFGPGREPPT